MYDFKPVTIDDIKEMSKWRYLGFMESIFLKHYFDNHDNNRPLKGPLDCDGFAVFKDSILFGLFEFYIKSDYIEIGLAINPEFVGKGFSKEYIRSGIDFLIENYDYKKNYVVLEVEKENLAAYNAYKKFGFIVSKENDEEIEMRYYLNR